MNKKAIKEIGDKLGELLADSYILYLKTQNFHWNVVDPRFISLHKMFQDQYEDLAEAADLVAEQIRMIGLKSPGTMKEFLSLTRLKEAGGKETGDQMLKKLADDHDTIVNYLHGMIHETQELGDEGTADMMIERLRVHLKTAWFLRSHLG